MKWLASYTFIFLLISCTNAQSQKNCAYKGKGVNYLPRIECQTDFDYIAGKPLTEKFGRAKSIKIVYNINNGKLYFTNSSRFPFHYDFCVKVLGSTDDLFTFNNNNYRENGNRQYILCNLNYYQGIEVYALELMAEDDTKVDDLYKLYKKIADVCFFRDKIKMLVSSPAMEQKFAALPALPVILADNIYKGRQFVSLNKGAAYGYIRKVSSNEYNKYTFNKHDIIILDGLPNQLPVVAGVITVPFQTPLCHISLLSQNRGTPNATYRKAWIDSTIINLENKLVYYEVNADTFLVRPASLVDAEAFWKKISRRKPIRLTIDTSRKQILNLKELSFKNVSLVGGKAANFAELMKIRIGKKSLPLPEASFAIPFYYYYKHLQQNNITEVLTALLADSVTIQDAGKLDKALKRIRSLIKDAPLDSGFLQTVMKRMKLSGKEFVNYRFRSSTNAEDVKGFNGAGLYDSKTGSLVDTSKQVEKAIKAVWASLWDDRAFAERQYFNIDQHSVAMGILVHRAFGEELANGVAITKHLYRKDYPAYTINAQVGETSVVTPPDSISCDEAIISLGETTGSNKIDVEYIGQSNIKKQKAVMTNDQLTELAKYLTAIKTHFFYKVEKGIRKDQVSFWNYGMDIEFKIDAHTGNLYIKQARNL